MENDFLGTDENLVQLPYKCVLPFLKGRVAFPIAVCVSASTMGGVEGFASENSLVDKVCAGGKEGLVFLLYPCFSLDVTLSELCRRDSIGSRGLDTLLAEGTHLCFRIVRGEWGDYRGKRVFFAELCLANTQPEDVRFSYGLGFDNVFDFRMSVNPYYFDLAKNYADHAERKELSKDISQELCVVEMSFDQVSKLLNVEKEGKKNPFVYVEMPCKFISRAQAKVRKGWAMRGYFDTPKKEFGEIYGVPEQVWFIPSQRESIQALVKDDPLSETRKLRFVMSRRDCHVYTLFLVGSPVGGGKG